MGTTTHDHEVFWRSGLSPRRLQKIGRRLLRRPVSPFDREAMRKIAAVREALARHGEALDWKPRR